MFAPRRSSILFIEEYSSTSVPRPSLIEGKRETRNFATLDGLQAGHVWYWCAEKTNNEVENVKKDREHIYLFWKEMKMKKKTPSQ